jgi:hypothetical protein
MSDSNSKIELILQFQLISTRFLTLAVTEADDTCMFERALFARPELVLESSEFRTF